MEGARARAPKQWCLNKHETINSFESWRQNIQYTLTLDPIFADFLVEGTKWGKKTKADPLRGFTNDTASVPTAKRRTAQQKVQHLELMLGQIANFCPIISRNTIVRNSTSIEGIWQSIRLHFGFQCTGAHFLDFCDIRLEADERPEDLYQRLMAFTEDNLVKESGGITHHGEDITEDEEMSPTLENMVVLTWLRLIHQDLPHLIKQRYGTELRARTLASIKPEISQALPSLLQELHCTEDAKILRSVATKYKMKTQHPQKYSTTFEPSHSQRQPTRPKKLCPLCQQAGRRETQHFLSRCPYLPDNDRQFLGKVRQVAGIPSNDLSTDDDENVAEEPAEQTVSRRVEIKKSPYIDAFYHHHPVRVIVDTGAETNLVKAAWAHYANIPIKKSTQMAFQADGHTPLNVVGETTIHLSRGNLKLKLEALVVESKGEDILAGVPFTDVNDITVRTSKREIKVGDMHTLHYGIDDNTVSRHAVRRTHAFVLKAPSSTTTVYPGEFVELDVPDDIPNHTLAVEPRFDTPCMRSVKASNMWPKPNIISSIGGKVRIVNDSNEPKVLKRNEHFCQVRSVIEDHDLNLGEAAEDPTNTSPVDLKKDIKTSTACKHSEGVLLDPDNTLPDDVKHQFTSLLLEYDTIFDPQIKGYNGACGPFEATVNMGPVQPPQRKGHVPQYARKMLVELQEKFDELETLGVFKCPEDVGITVEYLNPSFLVKKSNGGYRLVTAFADVGRYSKPQPSLMPDIESTIRLIACWKYIIVSDLSNAFYQIPLAQNSMKYCGVVTPFKGVRVYVRSAMGMPGSETALEELMCRVLGNLLQEGIVARVADDLYCGGNTPHELLKNWRKVLQALAHCNLKLSARKTVISPKSTTILGWIWTQGYIHASPHRISTLSTCDFPEKIGGLRSYIGAYKFLARVIPNCSQLLTLLEEATAGKKSQDAIEWTDALHSAFSDAKKALASNKAIILPVPTDQLWIVTDGSVKRHGIGATMYASRNGKPHLAGFFSAKLRKHQVTWLPCEIEALSIAAAIKHFSPYIVQSERRARVLTDSKPCVQAFEKLCRGEFSSSPRVATFLSVASRYQVGMNHLAGCVNVPSDFASRNAPDCLEPCCQICTFISRTEDSVVRNVTVQDIISGAAKPPFISRAAWLKAQHECADLRRAHAHLTQGTRPSKKLTNIRDVKRYLNIATIAHDGLLVVKTQSPLASTCESIIIPRQVLDGLLTALHLKLNHPSKHQLKLIVNRYFYALDMDKALERVAHSCHTCASLSKTPHSLIIQSTDEPPESIGLAFAADVIKRQRQLILVVRETVTSFTATCLLDNERHDTLRSGLLRLCLELCPIDGPPVIIRVDPAPGFSALQNDELLKQHHIRIELGRIKNHNKNPVAEHAVGELENELLRQEPHGGPVSSLTLCMATARLNSRIRSRGFSAREMWMQRDQHTNQQLIVNDQQLITAQHTGRQHNHPHSEKSKAHGKPAITGPHLAVGDIVYIYSDGNKLRARDMYLVVGINNEWCTVRKFAGSQLRSEAYNIKSSECYKVDLATTPHTQNEVSSSSTETYTTEQTDASLPDIPPELTLPSCANDSTQRDSDTRNLNTSMLRDHDTPTAEVAYGDNDTRQPAIGINSRPVRHRRPPQYLRDYITY